MISYKNWLIYFSTLCSWELLVESNLHLLQIRRQIDVFPTVSSSICANRFGPHNFTQRSLWIRAKNQFSKYAGNFNLWMLNPRPCKTHTLGKKNASIMYFFFAQTFQFCWKTIQLSSFMLWKKVLIYLHRSYNLQCCQLHSWS